MTTYRIVRFYSDLERPARPSTKMGLTLEEAQAHCQRPDTRGDLFCKNGCKKSYKNNEMHCSQCGTELIAGWFDGYTRE